MSDAERRAQRRRLAEAATPGPWEVRPGYHRTKWVVSVAGINYGENPAEDTAKHIFECDPATIIADLDRIAELEAALRFANDGLEGIVDDGKGTEEMREWAMLLLEGPDDGDPHGLDKIARGER